MFYPDSVSKSTPAPSMFYPPSVAHALPKLNNNTRGIDFSRLQAVTAKPSPKEMFFGNLRKHLFLQGYNNEGPKHSPPSASDNRAVASNEQKVITRNFKINIKQKNSNEIPAKRTTVKIKIPTLSEENEEKKDRINTPHDLAENQRYNFKKCWISINAY